MSKQGRVYRHGDGWAFDVDVGPSTGHRTRKRERGFPTRRAAVTALEATRARFVDVTDPTTTDVASYLFDWVDRMAAAQTIRPSTADSYRRIVAVAADRLGTLRLDRLTAADLDSLYHWLLTTGGRTGVGRSPRTVRYFHTVLRKALADAVRKRMLGRNVADEADPPSSTAAKAPEPVIWNTEAVQAFLGAEWLPNYRKICWALALGTGLRRGELAGLKWSDLDGDQLTVRRTRTTANHLVIESEPKTAKGRRTITVDAGLVSMLRSWRARQARLQIRAGIRSEYLLTGPTMEPWHPDALTQAWARDAARAVAEGLVLAPMRLHDCRHWNATQLVAANVDLNTVADRLGHATPAFTLAVYGHSDPERDRAAAGKLGAVLGL